MALICGCLLFLSLPSSVLADRGMLPIADTLVYEPGQKAIIGWDGEQEILILSTDVRAESDTMVLEIFPLPSQPESVEQGDFDSFVRIGELIQEHFPQFSWREEHLATMGGGEEPGAEVVFHEKIGVHDIWVVKADAADEFIGWAEDFLARNEIEYTVSSPELNLLVGDYIEEGIKFFVFDLIEISSAESSVEPIVYRFKTDYLYYPIKISSLISGPTRITLFLLTPEALDLSQLAESEGVRSGMMEKVTPYGLLGYELSGMGIAQANGKPIQFELSGEELQSIDPRLRELLGEHAWLTALDSFRFIRALDEDVKLTKALLSPVVEESDSANLIWVWVILGTVVLGVAGTLSLRYRKSM